MKYVLEFECDKLTQCTSDCPCLNVGCDYPISCNAIDLMEVITEEDKKEYATFNEWGDDDKRAKLYFKYCPLKKIEKENG